MNHLEKVGLAYEDAYLEHHKAEIVHHEAVRQLTEAQENLAKTAVSCNKARDAYRLAVLKTQERK